jgi:hypothetical protein
LFLFSKKQRYLSISVNNCRPISLLNNISKLLKFVIHDHVSHYLKLKFSPYQHGLYKSKSAITNLVPYIDFISHLVGCQREVDATQFDLSNAFELVPHTLHLLRLSAFNLSDFYVNRFRSYLSNRKS